MSNADISIFDDMDLTRTAVHFLTDGVAGNMDELLASAGLSLPLVSSKIPPWVSVANVQPDLVSVETLSRHWIPYTYDWRKDEVRWCLPQGRAVQPFYDEYISHCRQHFVSALVSPQSSLDSLLQYATRSAQFPDPAGFIFHLSRCGSTLVSGCFAEMEHCSVLSESPLLTEILLARHLSRDDKKALLRLCLYLQGRPSANQPHVIVKWNAWDIFYWELIREIWPRVPVLLLTRDPVEILASHAKNAGRHMSGDPALAHVHKVLATSDSSTSLLDYRIKILQGLMTKMLQVRRDAEVFLWDYAILDESALMEIFSCFEVEIASHQAMRLRLRLTRHSKSPYLMFQIDGAEKRRSFPPTQVDCIQSSLSDLHKILIRKAHK